MERCKSLICFSLISPESPTGNIKKTTKDMVTDNSRGQMEEFIKECGKIEDSMEKEVPLAYL